MSDQTHAGFVVPSSVVCTAPLLHDSLIISACGIEPTWSSKRCRRSVRLGMERPATSRQCPAPRAPRGPSFRRRQPVIQQRTLRDLQALFPIVMPHVSPKLGGRVCCSQLGSFCMRGRLASRLRPNRTASSLDPNVESRIQSDFVLLIGRSF